MSGQSENSSEEITEYEYDWVRECGMPPFAEQDRRVEISDHIPTFEEVEESGLLPDDKPLSDVDHVMDEDYWPTALAVEMGSGHRAWYHFRKDEEGDVDLVKVVH